jgi:DNA-3-methyladenine glycosylase
MPPVTRAFFERPCDLVARELLGSILLVNGVGGAIIETESYDGDDPASHSYLMRPRPRNAVMFGPAARAYIYRSYGIHWCLNFVCEPGSAVLIRAIIPQKGVSLMQARRGSVPKERLCAGPGRLCQALAVSGALNGATLLKAPFALVLKASSEDIAVGPRIGISKAKEVQRRFGVKDSEFLSKRF